MRKLGAFVAVVLFSFVAACGGSSNKTSATATVRPSATVSSAATPVETSAVEAPTPVPVIATEAPPATATPVPPTLPAPTNTSVPAPTATRAPLPTTPARTNCDPSYPTVCIAPPPPDLDCADIPYRRFKVVGADPHRFDADKDGIGCES
jgi:hypothetical protein